jgi:tetratricopeptide (TPR) repeat protein
MPITRYFAGLLPAIFLIAPAIAAQSATSAVAQAPTASSSFAKEGAVIESLQVNVRFENDGTGVADTILRAKIQSESGQRANGLLAFPYSGTNDPLEIKYVRVRKPDGTVVETPLDSVQDLTSDVSRAAPMYTDLREKHIAVRSLSIGDELEYSIRLTTAHPFAPGQFWYFGEFSKDAITLHEEINLNVPRDRPVKISSPLVAPTVSESGDRRIYSFTWSYLSHETPPKKVETGEGDAPPPDLQMTSFADWNAVAAWYSALQKPQMQITPEIRAKATELTAGKSTDDEKIRAIYDFVSLRFRYIGISLGQGRYQPHPASEVLANQFGDCKDKHTLFASLLQAAGIESFPVLIGSGMKLNPDFPTPALFDHVITAIPRGNSYLWLDTTPEVAPFALLQLPLRDKLAVVVRKDGSADLTKTPAELPFPFSQHFSMEASLDGDGTLDGKARMELRGDLEIIFRQAFRNTPEAKWKELCQNLSQLLGFAGTVDDVTVASPDDTSKPFWYAYSYHRPDYGDWQNHRITLPFPPFGLPDPPKDAEKSGKLLAADASGIPLDNVKPSAPAPIWLGPPQQIFYEAVIKLPAGSWTSSNPPVAIRKDFAEFTTTFSSAPGVLKGSRSLRILQAKVTDAQKPAYEEFHKAVDDDVSKWIIVSNGPASIPESTKSKNPDAQRLYDEAAQSLQLGAPYAATKSLNEVVKMEPNWLEAWLLLGKARVVNSDPDGAVRAFRKAISLAPSDARAYGPMAYILSQHQHLPEAIQAWRDLLSLDPENRAASIGLAQALMSAEKYSEVVPLWEKLVVTRPDDSGLILQLGLAYLHTGEQEKASQQFHKAMELNDSMEMLNSVAWYLAEAGVRLPEALGYAQHAVRETEAHTSDVSSDQAKSLRYSYLPSLDADWDTLGWVYFKMGDLDAAEKYLHAAWDLGLDPVVGDHLAQVYEKRGKRAGAAHAWALALAAIPSNGDADLRDKLLTRLAASHPADTIYMSSSKEFSRMTNFPLGPVGERQGTANFELTFSKTSVPDDVNFIGGVEQLRSYTSVIRALKFNVEFPDDGPTLLIRRGQVMCSHLQKECIFNLFPITTPIQATLMPKLAPDPAVLKSPGS